MRIVVLGSGGREHAIAWKVAQDIGWDNVFLLPGNPSIRNSYAEVDVMDFKLIKYFCDMKDIDTIFVGPEMPLAEGIVDYFRDTNIRVLGPDRQAAQLESSKIFSKQFMKRHGVATAPFEVFSTIEEASNQLRGQSNRVIKYDGLAGGKGVFVCKTSDEIGWALAELEAAYGNDCPLIVEDLIHGDEVSIIGFTDGQYIRLFQPSQDHKQAFDRDEGPNTGGMGAYCPIPDWNKELEDKIIEQIINPTLAGIQKEKFDYKGIIYFGVMVNATGPYLLEYNVRFGDPETEVLLPSLKSNFAALIEATLSGTLRDYQMKFHDGYFVDVVLASGGYPKKYETGKEIEGMFFFEEQDMIFHAGTKIEKDVLLTNGGRVLNIIGQGPTLDKAILDAYDKVDNIRFEGMHFRKDIGKRDNPYLKKESKN